MAVLKFEREQLLSEPMYVFHQCLEVFMRKVEEYEYYYAKKVRDFVFAELQEHANKIPGHYLNPSWMEKITSVFNYNYTPDQMRSILHLFYMAACEYFGPVRADVMLSSTIEEVSLLPEAKLFSPQILL